MRTRRITWLLAILLSLCALPASSGVRDIDFAQVRTAVQIDRRQAESEPAAIRVDARRVFFVSSAAPLRARSDARLSIRRNTRKTDGVRATIWSEAFLSFPVAPTAPFALRLNSQSRFQRPPPALA